MTRKVSINSKKADFQDFIFSLPRYFAVFFNPEKSEVLNDLNVRQALNYGTNKTELIDKSLLGYGQTVSSPILPEIYGFSEPAKNYSFDLQTRQKSFRKSGLS